MVQSRPISNKPNDPIWVVGSLNPVKINAVRLALASRWPSALVVGFETESGVPAQPMSDAQTRKGSINRAKFALTCGLDKYCCSQKKFAQDCSCCFSLKKKNKFKEAGCHCRSQSIMSVGLEGGLMKIGSKLWTTIWACVMDESGQKYLANGGRFLVPNCLTNQLYQGIEMGEVVAHYFQGRSVKTQEGLIGVMTKKFLDRTELYQAIVKLAVGQWFGRDWWQEIPELAEQPNDA
ncbi:MAG TPA: inosine/xanthosine triphosphatase [Candidatus Woesebacteria bacterium]|nr:inosine/xanthosine triphosphatase [Candidatus Woesebacteria bacterium]